MFEIILGVFLLITIGGPILAGIGKMGAGLTENAMAPKLSEEEIVARKEWHRLTMLLIAAQQADKEAGIDWKISTTQKPLIEEYNKAYKIVRAFENERMNTAIYERNEKKEKRKTN